VTLVIAPASVKSLQNLQLFVFGHSDYPRHILLQYMLLSFRGHRFDKDIWLGDPLDEQLNLLC
jgi:hypothetical protein